MIAELRGIHVLDGIPDELLEPLARAARVVAFPGGTVIFRQGEQARAAYLLTSGQVALEICTPGEGCKRILTVTGGELLGWSPALGQQQMTATARALMDVQAVELDGARLLAECERNPRLGYEFMKRTALALAKRLSATRLQLLNVYGSEMAPVADERETAVPTSTQP
jgi:CRP-like cAMP-binding protein